MPIDVSILDQFLTEEGGVKSPESGGARHFAKQSRERVKWAAMIGDEDDEDDEEDRAVQTERHQLRRNEPPPQRDIINGRRVKQNGTREEVWAGLARKTKGGLVKAELMQVKTGTNRQTGEVYYKIVSRKRSENARKNFHG